MVTWRAGSFEVLLTHYGFVSEPRPAKKGNSMHTEWPEYMTTLDGMDLLTIVLAAP